MTGEQWRGTLPDGMARCARCGSVLALDAFPPSKRKRNGRSSWCRDCATAANHAWRARNPEYLADYNAARRVSLSPVECASCGMTFSPRRRRSRFCCKACATSFRLYGPRTAERAAHHVRTCHKRDPTMTDDTPTPTPIDPHTLAFAELAAVIFQESGCDDARPGSMSTVTTDVGHEVYVESASRGRIRIGIVPHETLAVRARSIRLARN